MSKSPMKPTSSKTTGLQQADKTRSNEIGPLRGAIGSSTPLSDLDKTRVATPEQVAQCHQWLLGLSKLPLKALSEIEENEATKLISWLSRSSPRDWLGARIVTLLSHYFIAQTDERVAKAAAEDWIEILKVMPPWAISNACRKYLSSADNRRKPLPADILDLARREMWLVESASRSLSERSEKLLDEVATITPEERSRIAKGMIELARSMAPKTKCEKSISQDEHQQRVNAAKGYLEEIKASEAKKPMSGG